MDKKGNVKGKGKKDDSQHIYLVEKANKRQKGLYVHIKMPGIKGRNYKIKEGIPLDVYKQLYMDKWGYGKRKSKGTKGEYEKAWIQGKLPKGRATLKQQSSILRRKYANQLSKIGSLQGNIKSGKSLLEVQDVLAMSENDITNACKDLLRPLVLDDELLNVLVEESNMEKLKTRFSNSFKLLADKDKPLGDIYKANMTPRKAIHSLREYLKKGDDLSPLSDYFKADMDNKIQNLIRKYGFVANKSSFPINKGGDIRLILNKILGILVFIKKY